MLSKAHVFCVLESVQISSPYTTAVGSQLVLCLQVGGHWLSWWMVAAAAVSQIGQFEAEMSSDSFQLLGMAERGFLPKALGRRSKHDTPTVSLLMCVTTIWVVHVISVPYAGDSPDILALMHTTAAWCACTESLQQLIAVEFIHVDACMTE
jgi:amino acid transporter